MDRPERLIALEEIRGTVARYDDELIKQDGRWLFRRRREVAVPFKEGFLPYSEAAASVGGATMHSE